MGIVGQECPTYGPIVYTSFEPFCSLMWVLYNVNDDLRHWLPGKQSSGSGLRWAVTKYSDYEERGGSSGSAAAPSLLGEIAVLAFQPVQDAKSIPAEDSPMAQNDLPTGG